MVLRLTSDLPIAAGSDAHGCVGGERCLGTSEKKLAPHMEIWRSVLYATGACPRRYGGRRTHSAVYPTFLLFILLLFYSLVL